jgi:hypothetical protein
MFLGIFDLDIETKINLEYNKNQIFNYYYLIQEEIDYNIEKLKCLINYF